MKKTLLLIASILLCALFAVADDEDMLKVMAPCAEIP